MIHTIQQLYYILSGLFLVVIAGGIAFYLLAIFSVRKLRRRPLSVAESLPPITLLKPLAGAEDGLETYLETFFLQDYPEYEILFAVRHPDDPAVAIVQRLRARYQVPARLLIVGESPYANAKVWSMERMAEEARYDILVITDSDASVDKMYLRDIAACFEDPQVGAMTNLYRGVAGKDFWSVLEAIGMSTDFMAGVVVAERLEGMKFALGPSMAIRRECLDRIGGFRAMANYLADDFILGNWADKKGYRVVLSRHTINHHASASGFVSTFKHRLRWNRSSRFSRPDGYYGQGFTYGLAWALLFLVLLPSSMSLVAFVATLFVRFWLAVELGYRLLEDQTVLYRLHYIPVQDLISLATWLGGFMGREIIWRGQRYTLLEGGQFARLRAPHGQVEEGHSG